MNGLAIAAALPMLVFDFENPGSDYEHHVRERARIALAADRAERAADLWPILLNHAGASLERAAPLPALRSSLTWKGARFSLRAARGPPAR